MKSNCVYIKVTDLMLYLKNRADTLFEIKFCVILDGLIAIFP